ncbi:WD40-repeat-containing domain protein [Crucibulum laeve]|uniref:WD40-repeat-containing domain protein n=1 Tax=Crucibulum laeve TaxID=68775 RepID=A0A5C3MAB7_9AGAR|nr:WD40-repeat-containing domain protein [Crucibulum laeve]
MKLSDSDRSSALAIQPDMTAGPSSSVGLDGMEPMNGHTKGNGFTTVANGTSSSAVVLAMGNGVQKHGKTVAKVNLPGTSLYEDSFVDREEFVRLVIQSLRDVGYIESAATLEAESGYAMEIPEVEQFRQYILDGMWAKAEAALTRLGVEDEDSLWDAKFLISQQKYLELLEAKKMTAALHVLRNELAPLGVDSDQLHTLSSLIMCSEPEDLRKRASWDGASGKSRQDLLDNLHHYIPSSVMIPQRRFSTLLHQARAYQRQNCVYHNAPSDTETFSLYSDHQCDESDFPRITTTILEVHGDEVWNMEWSHDGLYLASASKDKTAIIWRAGSSPGSGSSSQDWKPHLILRDHPYAVGCLAWSLDDSVLLTSAENYIKMWNTKTGVCVGSLDQHTETVTALAWLPGGSGFISGGLDRKIIHWETNGQLRESWGTVAIRVTDLAVTPDFTRLIAVGMDVEPVNPPRNSGQPGETTNSAAGGNGAPPAKNSNRMIVFDLSTKETESSIPLEGELTSVKVSQNSQYALINHAPDEIHLWDLLMNRLARRYTGQRQGRHVIRSCFGGIDGNFVVSGSEDGNVYVWHRDTGVLLEVLSGHGEGSVNSVAWNPRNPRMFASCSDDHTIRIWESPVPQMMVYSPIHQPDYPLTFNGKGKGKTRQRWDGDGVDFGSGSETARM